MLIFFLSLLLLLFIEHAGAQTNPPCNDAPYSADRATDTLGVCPSPLLTVYRLSVWPYINNTYVNTSEYRLESTLITFEEHQREFAIDAVAAFVNRYAPPCNQYHVITSLLPCLSPDNVAELRALHPQLPAQSAEGPKYVTNIIPIAIVERSSQSASATTSGTSVPDATSLSSGASQSAAYTTMSGDSVPDSTSSISTAASSAQSVASTGASVRMGYNYDECEREHAQCLMTQSILLSLLIGLTIGCCLTCTMVACIFCRQHVGSLCFGIGRASGATPKSARARDAEAGVARVAVGVHAHSNADKALPRSRSGSRSRLAVRSSKSTPAKPPRRDRVTVAGDNCANASTTVAIVHQPVAMRHYAHLDAVAHSSVVNGERHYLRLPNAPSAAAEHQADGVADASPALENKQAVLPAEKPRNEQPQLATPAQRQQYEQANSGFSGVFHASKANDERAGVRAGKPRYQQMQCAAAPAAKQQQQQQQQQQLYEQVDSAMHRNKYEDVFQPLKNDAYGNTSLADF